jgi:hypothetical protein
MAEVVRMQKRHMILIILLLISAGVFAYPRLADRGETAVSVKDVTANPGKFLGPLTITDIVGDVKPDDGVILLVDYGCRACQLPVFVPFTAEQQTRWQTGSLYSGTLPAAGETVTVSGTLKKQDGYFMFDVDNIVRNGQVILSKVQNRS